MDEEGGMRKSPKSRRSLGKREPGAHWAGWCGGSNLGGGAASFSLASRIAAVGGEEGRVLAGLDVWVDPRSACRATSPDLPPPVVPIGAVSLGRREPVESGHKRYAAWAVALRGWNRRRNFGWVFTSGDAGWMRGEIEKWSEKSIWVKGKAFFLRRTGLFLGFSFYFDIM